MFCPRCGTQNIDDARFCRGCGADIALVPQAMTGHLPEQSHSHDNVVGMTWDAGGRRRGRHKEGSPPRLDKAITNAFMGIGFMLVSFSVLLFAPAGRIWWFWMLIPAFSMLGGGIAEFVRFKQHKSDEAKLPPAEPRSAIPPAPARVSAIPPAPARVSAVPPRRANTAELVPPPPSVTENTTRHLDMNTRVNDE